MTSAAPTAYETTQEVQNMSIKEKLGHVAAWNSEAESISNSACGSEDPKKPASACGSADPDKNKKPDSACGSACGSSDPKN